MRLVKAKLRNFRAHANTDITFPEKGVIGIVGSNEAGKTTILESLAFALFGSKGIRGRVKDLRWHGAKPRQVASVEWTLELRGNMYVVYRSETKAWVAQVDDNRKTAQVNIAQGHPGVNMMMRSLVGMDYSEFCASYLCQQKDVTRLMSMRPMERQTFVRAVLGAKKLDDAVKMARERKRAAQTRFDGMNLVLGDGDKLAQGYTEATTAFEQAKSLATVAETKRQDAVQLVTETRQRVEEGRRTREQRDQLASALASHEQEMAALTTRQRDVEDRLSQMDTVAGKIKSAQKQLLVLSDVESRVRTLNSAETRMDIRRTRTRRLLDLRAKRDLLTAAIKGGRGLVAAFDEDEWERVDEEMRASRSSLQRMQGKREETLRSAKQAAKAVQKEIDEIEDSIGDGRCPTCGQELANIDTLTRMAFLARRRLEAHQKKMDLSSTSHPDEVLLSANIEILEKKHAKLDTKRRAADSSNTRISLNEQTLHNTNREIKQLRAGIAEMGEIKYDAEEHNQLEASRDRLVLLKGRVASWREAVAQRSELEALKIRLESEHADVALVFVDDTKRMDKLHFDPVVHLALEKALADRKAELEVWTDKYQDARASRVRAYMRVDHAKRELEQWQERKAKADGVLAELRVETKVVERLSEFRVAFLSTIHPEMEELLTGFISMLTDGRHDAVSMDDKFGVVLHEGGLESPVISGGTEDITALALRLAISQLITQRSGNPLSLLILDEPFGSLDVDRRANVLGLLHRLSSVFPQIVLISHVAATREAADHVIELEHNEIDGFTKVAR